MYVFACPKKTNINYDEYYWNSDITTATAVFVADP